MHAPNNRTTNKGLNVIYLIEGHIFISFIIIIIFKAT
jgi:hypothetical protein